MHWNTTVHALSAFPWHLLGAKANFKYPISKEFFVRYTITCRFKVNLACHYFRFNQYFFWVSNHWFWNGKNWPGSNLRFFQVHYAIVLKRQLWTWENIWFDQTRTFSRFKTNLELKIPDFWFTLNRQLLRYSCDPKFWLLLRLKTKWWPFWPSSTSALAIVWALFCVSTASVASSSFPLFMTFYPSIASWPAGLLAALVLPPPQHK